MYIVTTIYCADLDLAQHRTAQHTEKDAALQPAPSDSVDASREFLGIYQGQSRVMPKDTNG